MSTRREILEWITPVVAVSVLPAHAQTTTDVVLPWELSTRAEVLEFCRGLEDKDQRRKCLEWAGLGGEQ